MQRVHAVVAATFFVAPSVRCFFEKVATMQRRFFVSSIASTVASTIASSLLSLAGVLAAPAAASAQTAPSEPVALRVLTHGSFSLPKDLLAKFEAEHNVKLNIIKAGSAGEMVNKLILTKAQPLADVAFGIDNTLMPRVRAAGIIEAYTGAAMQRKSVVSMDDGGKSSDKSSGKTSGTNGSTNGGVVPVDYGYINLNIDKAWFAKAQMPYPKTMSDLAKPEYAKLLVVQNPATSSAGQAFLMATIAGLGEQAAFDWWAKVRAGGVQVAKGWTEAYNTEFTRNGGTRPIVVSYATSPAAEVFYSKEKITESPTANLFIKGAVFRQVEGVALIKGGNAQARPAANKFIEFLRSPEAQTALQTKMWMYPADAQATRAEVLQQHGQEPAQFDKLPASLMDKKAKLWVQRWVQVVLK